MIKLESNTAPLKIAIIGSRGYPFVYSGYETLIKELSEQIIKFGGKPTLEETDQKFLIKNYGLEHPNFKGFELREKAEPNFILFTTEGVFGKPQIIKIMHTIPLILPTSVTKLIFDNEKGGNRKN